MKLTAKQMDILHLYSVMLKVGIVGVLMIEDKWLQEQWYTKDLIVVSKIYKLLSNSMTNTHSLYDNNYFANR